MEIKQDLIMNFDFRTYCENFFAGQSKTAAEVVAEFERITHTSGLIRFDEEAQFVLDDKNGLHRDTNERFNITAGRAINIIMASGQRLTVAANASAEISNLFEISWKVDLKNDKIGYQVSDYNIENSLHASTSFVQLDNTDVVDVTQSKVLYNDYDEDYYAIPSFLINDQLMYNRAQPTKIDNFNFQFNGGLEYPLSFYNGSKEKSKQYWSFKPLQEILYDNFKIQKEISSLIVKSIDDNGNSYQIQVKYNDGSNENIDFIWDKNTTNRLYVFRIDPITINSEDLAPYKTNSCITIKGGGKDTVPQEYELSIGDNVANYQINVIHGLGMNYAVSFNNKQTAQTIKLDKTADQSILYQSFDHSNTEIDVLHITEFYTAGEKFKDKFMSHKTYSISSDVNNGNNYYNFETPIDGSGQARFPINTSLPSNIKDIYNFQISENKQLSDKIQLECKILDLSNNSLINKPINIDNNSFFYQKQPIYNTWEVLEWYAGYDATFDVFLGNGTISTDSQLSLMNNNPTEQKQCDYKQKIGSQFPTHTAILSSKREVATTIEQKRNYLYTINAAANSEPQVTSILSLYRPLDYFYYSDNSWYKSSEIEPGNYYLWINRTIRFTSLPRYIIGFFDANDLEDSNINDANKSIYFINNTGTDADELKSTVELYGIESDYIDTLPATVTNYQFKDNDSMFAFKIKCNIVDGYGIQELITPSDIVKEGDSFTTETELIPFSYYSSCVFTWVLCYNKLQIIPYEFIHAGQLTFSGRFNNNWNKLNANTWYWVPILNAPLNLQIDNLVQQDVQYRIYYRIDIGDKEGQLQPLTRYITIPLYQKQKQELKVQVAFNGKEEISTNCNYTVNIQRDNTQYKVSIVEAYLGTYYDAYLVFNTPQWSGGCDNLYRWIQTNQVPYIKLAAGQTTTVPKQITSITTLVVYQVGGGYAYYGYDVYSVTSNQTSFTHINRLGPVTDTFSY